MKRNNLFADITPVKNISGGSGAETWVVRDKKHGLFVRKFAEGNAGRKLKAQTEWLNKFKSLIHCPEVLHYGNFDELYFYDMKYLAPSDTAFQMLLGDDSTKIAVKISSALEDFNLVSEDLNPQQNFKNRETYISEKLFRNLEVAKKNDPSFANFSEAKNVIINGVQYTGLSELLNHSKIKKILEEIMSEPLYNLGHGDLTLSNLLIKESNIAFIDPNPNFELISKAQEYSKVLQSTLVKYELFNNIELNFEGSNYLDYSYGLVPDFTEINNLLLSGKVLKNLNFNLMIFHLSIHLARILPYIKPENKNKSYVYLAEITKLLNSIANENYDLN